MTLMIQTSLSCPSVKMVRCLLFLPDSGKPGQGGSRGGARRGCGSGKGKGR